MSNYKRMNTNTLQLGQDQGTCSIIPQTSNRIKCQMDLVKSTGANLIDYNESTNTLDFNNATIANFTGGGGGGGGDVFLANTQTFTGVNTFSGNTVLSTANTGNITTTGTIAASSTVTGSGLITAGTVECDKVESVGNVEIATGDLEVTTGNCTVGGNTTVGAISTNNITTTGTIACNSSIAGASLAAQAGDITCTSGNINGLSLQSSGGQVNLKTGNARIESDLNDNTRIQADANTNTIVCRLGGTGADHLQLSYDSGTQKSVLQLYDFSASPPQYYPVGANPADFTTLVSALQTTSLTFNSATTQQFDGSIIATGTALFNGVAVQLGAGTNQCTIQLMNDSTDITNVTQGVMAFDTAARLTKAGTTSGATDIFTATDTILDRSAASFTPTLFTLVTGTPSAGQVQLSSGITNSLQGSIQAVRFGTNGGTPVYRVSCRGRLSGFSVNNVGPGSGSIDLFTLPVGYRPIQEQNFVAQGHPDEKQVRIDIATSGLVSIAEGASSNTASFCNLGGIDIWAGI